MIVWRRVVAGVAFWGLVLSLLAAPALAQTKPGAGLIISHTGFKSPQRRGAPLPIDATIASPTGVRKAEVFCRPAGGRDFTALPMELVSNDVYRAVVPDWMTAGAGLEYYITATDQGGRSASQGFVGFPLLIQLVAGKPLSQEERLKTLDDTLDAIRKSKEAQGDYPRDPRQERDPRQLGEPNPRRDPYR
jgi:hypothetical protein